MEAELSLEFLRVVENGAIAAARTMGFGDRHKADEVAVEAMRRTVDKLLHYAGRLGIEAKAKFAQTHKEVVEKELALAD